MPGSPQPAPGVPQAWHRPGFALSSPEPLAPGPAGSALPRVSWHRWAPGTRAQPGPRMSALPRRRRPGQQRGSAQPSPGLRGRRMRSHLSVHGRKGPEAAGPPGRGGVRRGTGPRGAWPRARKTRGPAQLGSGAGARTRAAPGGREEATRARGGGAARSGEGGEGTRPPSRAGRTGLAASASRPPPPAGSLRARCLASPGGRVAAGPAHRRQLELGLPLRPLPVLPRRAARPGPAPRAPRRPPPALSSPPPAPRSPPDWPPGRALLPPRPRGSAAPSARCWQARAGPALREGAFKATHTPPRTERLAGSSNPGDGEMS